jgi:hypothetical protein
MAAAAVLLSPHAGSAQALSADRARGAFADAGFLVEDPHAWTWTSPPNVTFRVIDLQADRIVMVVVYPDAAAADAEQERASTRAALLVPGYGPPTWHNNVALVQSSRRELARHYALEHDHAAGTQHLPAGESPGARVNQTPTVAAEYLSVLTRGDRIDF